MYLHVFGCSVRVFLHACARFTLDTLPVTEITAFIILSVQNVYTNDMVNYYATAYTRTTTRIPRPGGYIRVYAPPPDRRERIIRIIIM